MRIITGDECGLLKEVIPELCRPSSSSTSTNIHAGKARPSATSIQAAASSYGTANEGNNQLQNGIQRLETGHNIQSRERGIISLSFLPPPTSSNNEQQSSSEFNFAALRTNGIVETWNGQRINNSNDDEVNVTSARYKKYDGLVKGILPDQQQSSGSNTNNKEGKDVSGSDNEDKETQEKKTKGWYTNQPIRPIGMVSNYSPSSSNSTFTTNPILATCDSIGTISLINTNKLSDGVISTYNAFDIDTTSSSSSTGGGSKLPTPSSSKNNSNSIHTLTYTRGRYANVSITTSIAIDSSGNGNECKLAVGGRERGVRLLDLETGKLLWKAKNLPPDPQTLLQQPMWTTSIQFLHTPTSAISSGNIPSNLLATGSAYKQVQIYDIRVSSGGSGAATSTRRPVLYTPDELLSHRITSICQLNNNGNTIAVGDTIGDVHLLDMRKMHSGKPSHRSRYNNTSSKHKAKEEIGLGRLVGPGGSIKQLYVHPTLPIISCVGLDRKLWTYDVNRHKMIDCIYLKQRLNCMLVCDDESWNVTNDEDEIDEEENGSSMNVDDLEVEDEVEDYVNSDDDDDEEDEVDNGQVAKKEESKSGSSSSSDSSSGEDETESESGSGSEEEEENVVSKKRRTK